MKKLLIAVLLLSCTREKIVPEIVERPIIKNERVNLQGNWLEWNDERKIAHWNFDTLTEKAICAHINAFDDTISVDTLFYYYVPPNPLKLESNGIKLFAAHPSPNMCRSVCSMHMVFQGGTQTEGTMFTFWWWKNGCGWEREDEVNYRMGKT